MTQDKILDQFLSELSRSSQQVRRSQGLYARKFLSFAKEVPLSQWNKTLVNDFLRELEKEGYAKGTIRCVYSIVKRVFDAAKTVYERERTSLVTELDSSDPAAVTEVLKRALLPGPTWDVGKRAAPKVGAGDVVKPAATLEELETMIAAGRDGVLTPAEKAYLLLSSVYGLRREELCRVRAEHLDFSNKRIYVFTCKGGEQRHQLLCDEGIPPLEEYDFKEAYSPFQMSSMYWRIAVKSGLTLKAGSGWHSPRRFLDTELVELFGAMSAHIFLRWKLSSSSLMVERYYSRDPLEIDAEVLSKHPIVRLWG